MAPKALDVPTSGGTLRFRKGGGFATYDTWPAGGPLVQLRFNEADDGRVCIVELHVVARDAGAPEVTGTVVRSISFGAIEATVNGSAVRDRVLAHVRSEGPAFEPARLGPVRRTSGELTGEIAKHPDRPSRRLRIPKGRTRPDEFYAQVAELYTWLAGPGESRKPAVEIANDNDVPTTTVHRWLREARSRGLLGRGQRAGRTDGGDDDA